MLLCRFGALKYLRTADAPGTVAAIKSAIKEDCELTKKSWLVSLLTEQQSPWVFVLVLRNAYRM